MRGVNCCSLVLLYERNMRLRNVPGSREAIADSPLAVNEPTELKGRWKEEFENEKFYNLYYFVVENGKTGIINSVTLTTGVFTSVLSVFGISSIILQYDLLIIACAFLGVLISCECSMKKKKMQYEYKIEVKNLWQFKYYQSAYSSTRLSNLSLRINWEYDISNTNYDLFQ